MDNLADKIRQKVSNYYESLNREKNWAEQTFTSINGQLKEFSGKSLISVRNIAGQIRLCVGNALIFTISISPNWTIAFQQEGKLTELYTETTEDRLENLIVNLVSNLLINGG